MAQNTWLNAAGSLWTDNNAWSLGVPGATDDVVIAVAPVASAYTVTLNTTATVKSVTLNQDGATLAIAGGKLIGAVSVQAGTVTLDNGATLGGTLSQSGGDIVATNGTLSYETINGAVSIDAGTPTSAQQGLTITGGLTLASGASLILDTQLPSLTFLGTGTQTINGGTLTLGASPINGIPGFPYYLGSGTVASTNGGAVTLTLGSGLIVHVQGDYALKGAIYNFGGTPSAVLQNQGSIVVDDSSFSLSGFAGVTNSGRIEVGSHSFSTNMLSNSGTIHVGAGGTLTIGSFGVPLTKAGPFANTGSIVIDGGNATFELSLSVAQLSSLTYLNSATATVLNGTLSNSGLTVFGSGSVPALTLGALGVLSGGTISTSGIAFRGGTLTNITVPGVLSLTGADTNLTFGAGVILDSVGRAQVSLSGGATLHLASGASPAKTDFTVSGGTLDFGSGVTLTSQSTLTVGPGGVSGLSSPYLQSALLNQGTITIGAGAAASLPITNAGNVSVGLGATLRGLYGNSGSLSVSGYVVNAYGSSFTNSGSITIGSSGTLQLGTNGSSGNQVTPGRITVGGGVLALFSDETWPSLANVTTLSGGTVLLGGNLANTGHTLALGAGQLNLGLAGGTITGGVLVTNGGNLAEVSPLLRLDGSGSVASGGTLNGVSVRGFLSIGSQTLAIGGRTTFAGADGTGRGTIGLTGLGAGLQLQQALDNVDISIGSATGATLSTVYGGGAILGSGVTLTQTGAQATFGAGGTLTFNGSYLGNIAGGTLVLGFPQNYSGALSLGGSIALTGETLVLGPVNLTGSGSISVTDGKVVLGYGYLSDLSRLHLSNSILSVGGSLALQGGTLTAGLSGASALSIGRVAALPYNPAVVSGGVISDPTGTIAYGNGVILTDVAVYGAINLTALGASVQETGNFVLRSGTGGGVGTLNITGVGASFLADSPPLDWVNIRLGSAATSYNGTLLGAAQLSGASLGNGGSPPPGTLTLGGHALVTQAGRYAAIQSASYGDAINGGQIVAGFAKGLFTISGNSFTNTGTLAVSNGDRVVLAATTTTNTGVLSIGAGSTVALDIYNLSLNGGAITNLGTIALAGGGFTELVAAGSPAVAVTNALGARIVGAGTVSAPIINYGLIEATGALTVRGNVVGRGTMQVDAGATLTVTGAVGAAATARFAGTGVLGLAPKTFLGTVAAFATGDTIDLLGTSATAAAFSGKSILVTLAGGGTLALRTDTALSGALTVTAGTHGDTLLSFAGAAAQAVAAPTVAAGPGAVLDSAEAWHWHGLLPV